MITFDDIYHVGIIVPDMEAAMDELGRRFNVGWRDPSTATVRVRDHAGDRILSPRVTFCDNSTPIALELIEALPGTVWSVTGRSQLHHFGLYVDSVQAAIDELGPGMELEMAGLDRDGMLAGFCYVTDDLGVRMELVARGGLPPLDD
ncbi:MAG: VOC family protein [Chloroflexi bacterium]|nr:VOC family protein [Chloroflexota bacterium]